MSDYATMPIHKLRELYDTTTSVKKREAILEAVGLQSRKFVDGMVKKSVDKRRTYVRYVENTARELVRDLGFKLHIENDVYTVGRNI